MGCDFPLKAYRPSKGGGLVFNPKHALNSNNPIDVPCGKCTGCILKRAQEWAIRCYHEASMQPDNCFITLTYDDRFLPLDYSVDKRVWQLFMMRLREAIYPTQIRFFACGEYGGKSLRPHYHALIFNYSFPDKTILKLPTPKQNQLYTSKQLEKLWPFGFNTIGDAGYKSAAYTARYTLKKTGDASPIGDDYYLRMHPLTFELVRVQPEFLLMSRMPGLGRTWFNKYKSDIFPCDFVVVDGQKLPVPGYYQKLLEEDELEQIKRARRRASARPDKKLERTDRRRYEKMVVRNARIQPLKRDL